ncbi:MAG: NAD(P)-dependent alcohol dehydrogenase [Microbacterium sp.]|uniref:NAD(P)-dependent alcohol dehydrogenase n=1 Tax=Microbacterium sp. TaxID=51671 RepID=UPI0039E303AF
MPTVAALAAPSAHAPFERTTIARREPGPRDVVIDIAFAGICHSDIHTVRDEWGAAHHPLVPGHEIAGVVSAVGGEVTRFAVGDHAGVGCFVDSCRECENCLAGEEQYCLRGTRYTYNTPLPEGDPEGAWTQGGYSRQIVVDEDYTLRIPDSLPLDAAAPLLCAGITLYSPLKHWGVGPGTKVGILGMGGLGHMGVKIAAALGAEVTVLGHSLAKRDDGIRFGATRYLATTDPATFRELHRSLDLIVSTVSADIDLNRVLGLLRLDGALVNVGLPEKLLSISPFALTDQRLSVAGSNIGGIRETQEMLDFCAEHDITPQIEVIDADGVDAAWDRVVASDVRYRFVIDVATI